MINKYINLKKSNKKKKKNSAVFILKSINILPVPQIYEKEKHAKLSQTSLLHFHFLSMRTHLKYAFTTAYFQILNEKLKLLSANITFHFIF